jgi:hypothetical protein
MGWSRPWSRPLTTIIASAIEFNTDIKKLIAVRRFKIA